MKTLLSFLVLLVLLWLAPVGHTCDEHQKEECFYTLEVKTTCFPGSGTENHVRLKIGDFNGTEICRRHLSEPIEGDKEQPFQWCKTAKFKFGGPCFKSSVCRMQFFVEGTDIWRLEHAILEKETGTVPDKFVFNKNIKRNDWDGRNYCEGDPELASWISQNYDNQPDSKDESKRRRIAHQLCLTTRRSGGKNNWGKKNDGC